MNPIFKKLQFKEQEKAIVLNAPKAFRPAMLEIEELTEIAEEIDSSEISWLLAFAAMGEDLAKIYEEIRGKLTSNDPVLWIAYPKKTSKKYKSDITRDSGHWTPLGEMGFEGVRQVAIDEDWSALRFRHIDFIKKLTRDKNRIMSEKGKRRKGK